MDRHQKCFYLCLKKKKENKDFKTLLIKSASTSKSQHHYDLMIP